MNERYENYFVQALHDAKVKELIDTYAQNGFIVIEQPPSSDVGFDVILHNEQAQRTVAFEIKLLPLGKTAEDNLRKLSSKAAELGYDFRLVTISRPTKPSIEVEWFDKALLSYLVEHPLAEIDEIATHVSYAYAEATIEAIEIADHQVTAVFNGILDIEAQHGSITNIENDIGIITSYSIPIEGNVVLDLASKTIKEANLRADLSSWYA